MTAVGLAAGVGMVCGCLSALAATSLDVDTSGGVVEGTRITHVTSLADAGAGTLREALGVAGPRVIVFDVAGYIDLQSDLTIENGQVTIAGQTAPGPGVVLRGGTVNIRASDIVVEHVAIYAGSSANPERAANRDGINIYGRPSRKMWVKNVVLRNLSVGWGVDENIGINGLVDGVKIERSLIAEALMRGGHPKGEHSMNLLLGNPVKTVLILGNVFAASNQRSPRLTQGNIVEFLNNLVYGFGRKASHIDSSKSMAGAARIDVIGNLYGRTPDSRCNQRLVQISETFFKSEPPSKVHVADNTEMLREVDGCQPANADDSRIAQRLSPIPLAIVPSWHLVPSESIYPGILDLVGSHPARRNPIDARILNGIRDGTIRLVDNEQQIGGWPPITPVSVRSKLPLAGTEITDDEDLAILSRWLCERSAQAVGSDEDCD
jgi:hypothetical protein